MARWSHRGFLVQHWQAMRAEAEIELYVGNPLAARERLRRDATKIRRSFILESQFMRISNAFVRGRCAIAAAIADPARRAARLAAARRIVRKLEREQASHSAPLAALMAAGIASIEGDHEEAARALQAAIELGKRVELGLQVQAARFQLGSLLGGKAGRELLEDAASALAAEGVRAPARFVAMFAPGRFQPPIIAARS
jgi:hypothetical protein